VFSFFLLDQKGNNLPAISQAKAAVGRKIKAYDKLTKI
jgi:hypothetical protein